jgi:hypothetical protein
VAFGAGAIVAWIVGGPIAFNGFKGPLASFAISAVIGITAGLSCADDTGRRYLIGVAAAVQFAIFPVWFGIAAVLGLPAKGILGERLLSFVINLITISVAATIAYALLHIKNGRTAKRVALFVVLLFFLGIYAPDSRASFSAMAMACCDF